jgi:hypothetical protein
MVLDGAALLDKGVTSLTVDGDEVELTAESIDWGSQDGKRPDLQGPFNQVFHKPFCYVYSNYQDIKYKQYVSYLVSTWTIIGNGHACALPIGKLTPEVRSQYNIIYVGIPVDKVPVPDSIPFTWDEDSITVDGKTVDSGTLLFVFPEEDHLSAAWLTTPGEEFMLFWHSPFSSRSGMPDYVGWTNGGAYLAGFFDPDWNFVPALGIGP